MTDTLDRYHKATAAGKAAGAFILWQFAFGLFVRLEGIGQLESLTIRILGTQVGGLALALWVLKSNGISLRKFLCLRNPFKAVKAVPGLMALLLGVWIVASISGMAIAFLLKLRGHKPIPHPIVEYLNSDSSAIGWIILSFGAVVIAPVCEEIIFRACFYRFFRFHNSRLKAFIITSAVFALIHLNVFQMTPIFILALVLQTLFVRYRNLYFPIIFHSMFNAASLILVALIPYLKQFIELD